MREQHTYRLGVCTYEHGEPTLAEFKAADDEQASKIGKAILNTWEAENDDIAYRVYLHPKGQPMKDVSV